MFTTEDEWRAAYSAAYDQLLVSRDRGDIELPNGSTGLMAVAQRIATAVIRSADSGDITDLPGVAVERVGRD